MEMGAMMEQAPDTNMEMDATDDYQRAEEGAEPELTPEQIEAQ